MRGNINQTQNRLTFLAWAFVIGFTAASCGRNYREITLVTPIPLANPTKNLSSMFHLISGGSSSIFLTTPTCRQTEMRAGFTIGGFGPPQELIKVDLDTEILDDTTQLLNQYVNSTQIDATRWLNQHSSLRAPIRFKVPTTGAVSVGFMGVFYEPVSVGNSAGSDCRIDPQPANLNLSVKSFLMKAKAPAPPSSTTVELRPWVIRATDITYPLTSLPNMTLGGIQNPTTSSESSIFCLNTSQPRTCANSNILSVQIQPQTYPNNGIPFELRYFSLFGPNKISHRFTQLSASPMNNVLKERRFELSYSNGGTPKTLFLDLDQKTIKDLDFPSVQPVNFCTEANINNINNFQVCVPWGTGSLTSPSSTTALGVTTCGTCTTGSGTAKLILTPKSNGILEE